MKLYWSNASPYARKVRMVIAEKALGRLAEEISVEVYADPPELLAVTPLGKIPALVMDDGLGLFDSPVICAFLDAHPEGQGPRLQPQSGPERWMVMRAEALGDGITDLAFGLRQESLKPDGEKSPTSAARARGQLLRSLDAIWPTLRTLPQGTTLGHLALAVALGYLDFRHADVAWRSGRPELAAWYEQMCARPSVSATAPK
jgi:glutathione S-transferase